MHGQAYARIVRLSPAALGVFLPILSLIEISVGQKRLDRVNGGLRGLAGLLAHAELAGLRQPEHGDELPGRGRCRQLLAERHPFALRLAVTIDPGRTSLGDGLGEIDDRCHRRGLRFGHEVPEHRPEIAGQPPAEGKEQFDSRCLTPQPSVRRRAVLCPETRRVEQSEWTVDGLANGCLLQVAEQFVLLPDHFLATHVERQEGDNVGFLARRIGVDQPGERAQGIQLGFVISPLNGQDLGRVAPRHG